MRRLLEVAGVALALVVISLLGNWATSDATPGAVGPTYVCPESGWDTTDSPVDDRLRAEQFTYGGLRLAVAGPTHKQSAYTLLAAPVRLADVDESGVGMTYVASHGYAPGYQLTTVDADGTWRGNLIWEDGRWWASRPAFWSLLPEPGQSGTTTLAQFRAAYPDRLVYRVGFSLGSGAADSAGTLRDLSFQGTRWTFTRSCVAPTLPTTWSAPTRPSHPASGTTRPRPPIPTWHPPTSWPSSTTTTTTTTTVAPTTTTTTTSPPTTTTDVARPTTSTTAVAAVRSRPTPLASTGVDVVVPVAIGVLLVALGALLLLRRRAARR